MIEAQAAVTFRVIEQLDGPPVVRLSLVFVDSRHTYSRFVSMLQLAGGCYRTMTIVLRSRPTAHVKQQGLNPLVEFLFCVRVVERLCLRPGDEHFPPGLRASVTTNIENGLQLAKSNTDTEWKETNASVKENSH